MKLMMSILKENFKGRHAPERLAENNFRQVE